MSTQLILFSTPSRLRFQSELLNMESSMLHGMLNLTVCNAVVDCYPDDPTDPDVWGIGVSLSVLISLFTY
jgi:hypothetical protein